MKKENNVRKREGVFKIVSLNETNLSLKITFYFVMKTKEVKGRAGFCFIY